MWVAVRGPEGRDYSKRCVILAGVQSVCVKWFRVVGLEVPGIAGVTGWFVLLLCLLSLIFPAYLLLYTKPDLSFPLPRRIRPCEIGRGL